eukprot:scpid38410/ scgid0119/ Protein phosphatase 1 regulatory subunit 16A; Myosin phosphatase targeting subunit 3
MATRGATAEEEDLISEVVREQAELCEQAKEYRRCSLAERIARATAYRAKQLRRWDERGCPLLLSIIGNKKREPTLVKFNGSYSLIDASSRDDIDEVRSLLEEGADPNSVNFDGLSALHQCCIEDSPEIAQLLIDYRADVNLRDNEWWTPLHAAASCGLQHIVELLLDNGACVAVLNSDGDLPIDMADTTAIFDLLKDAQVEQGYSDEDIAYQRYELEEKMTSDLQKGLIKPDDRDRMQATPLHVAAAHGLDKVAELLLHHGSNVNARDLDDWTAAHAASCWGHASVLAVLAKYGADFDARTKNYDTPYSLTEDPELQAVIMDLKLQAVDKLASRKANRSKRMTTSSRGHSVKRSTLERKKSLSRHEAKNEAMQRVQAQQQFETGQTFDNDEAASKPPPAEAAPAEAAGKAPALAWEVPPKTKTSDVKAESNDAAVRGEVAQAATGKESNADDAPFQQQQSSAQLMPKDQDNGTVATQEDEDKSCCTIL